MGIHHSGRYTAGNAANVIARGLRPGLILLVLDLMVFAPAAAAAEAGKPSPAKSGIEFAGPDVRSLQADDFANPGMLWVARGEKLWRAAAGSSGRDCAACHGDAAATMKGVATRYPRVEPGAGGLVNLEGRINQCRTVNQGAAALPYESDDLLGLTAYVAHQSRGMPIAVVPDGENRASFERGRDFYHARQGQVNLSCSHCHDRHWGGKLGPETITQGHGNAYPAYRLEWQAAGSLHRRFRSCLAGIRAEPLPGGAQQFVELELYLAWRAGGLRIETPGVRR